MFAVAASMFVILRDVIVGEIRFDRNGCPVATLMHVDTSLELWAFIDVYGTTQRIKSCGKFISADYPYSSS